MNLAYVKGRVEVVRALVAVGDFEGAHGEEDALYRDVLAFIAQDATGIAAARSLAAMALALTELQYPRACA